MSLFNWMWRQFHGADRAAAKGRKYDFPLPYTIKAVYLFYGVSQLKQEGVFQKLPEDLQKKMQRGVDMWHDVRVTKGDLDRIPTESWASIAHKLNLTWSE